MTRRVVVFALGSPYRRDDGAGAELVARLALDADLPACVEVVGTVAEPLELLGRWDGADLAVVCDTLRSGSAPGTVSVLELRDSADLSGSTRRPGAAGTHGIGLVSALRLARATRSAPQRLVVVGIEGEDLGLGTGLSERVEAALEGALSRLRELLVLAAGVTGN